MSDIIFYPTGSISSFPKKINMLSFEAQTVMIMQCDTNVGNIGYE